MSGYRRTSRASEIIERGDPAEILGMALGARCAAARGEFCECEQPDLVGDGLMCGHCLRENREQIERRERRSREPHAFTPREPSDEMCDICTRWRDDPIHKLGTP